MEKTWKSTTAGILNIFAGVMGLIGGIMFKLAVGGQPLLLAMIPEAGVMLDAVTGLLIALGIVAIAGGFYALKRRIWGLALAGSLCSLIFVFPLGIPAIVFTAMGKGEFK
jgi:hypothetical protein